MERATEKNHKQIHEFLKMSKELLDQKAEEDAKLAEELKAPLDVKRLECNRNSC